MTDPLAPKLPPNMNDKHRMTVWDEPDSLVQYTFTECEYCHTISGFPHSKHCRRKVRNMTHFVHSSYGQVDYLEWCRIEATRLTVGGTRVVIRSHPAGQQPEQAEFICLARELG